MPPADGKRNAVKDPLNPRDGLLELPGAVQRPYYSRRDGAATMTRYEHTLSSQQLKQERRIIIYTPPDYDMKGKPYVSVFMFAGEDRDGVVFATWTFENMIADKKIPPMVVVRIVNPNQASRLQLSGHDPFFQFLNRGSSAVCEG
jgi:enterochelin esterase-like enzyme